MSRRPAVKKLDHSSETIDRKQRPKRHSRNKADYDQRRPKVEKYYEGNARPRRKSKPSTDRQVSTSFERREKVDRARRIRQGDDFQKQKIRRRHQRHEPKITEKKPAVVLFSFLGNLFFYVVTIGIIMMAVMFSFSSKSTASIFGYRFYTVLTNSMVPQENGLKGGFYAGDIVIVKMTDGTKVKKNDIVTFAVGDGSRYLTHRMVDRKDELNGEKGDFLITKGDANQSNDPPIAADRVLGKVIVAVPKVGDFLDFIREEFWACLVCVLSLYGFFLVLKAYLFSPKEKYIRRKRTSKQPIYEQ
ncbi:signal peptidase I [Enterococcus wangshanyuanii]|uniref:Signal peptidase I n=1 Tax=Enterococcus wangshanyuanii TaxID=2005703 RepID=A0ABQ1P958_9ENTE|nr:signal peptidase I [Enterococcus wangshanyuanii]GGC93631.1 hypothetical protein GCM10011573_24090 [Enterococcus wangshanyuanii]